MKYLSLGILSLLLSAPFQLGFTPSAYAQVDDDDLNEEIFESEDREAGEINDGEVTIPTDPANVPEPVTILGSMAALGMGYAAKRKLAAK